MANPTLVEHSATFEPRVEQVADGVWTSIGHSLANATVIQGAAGRIVIDTGDCIEQAALQDADLSAHATGPLAALVYSHNHYALGAQHYVAQNEDVRILAHPRLHANLAASLSDIGPFLIRRACIQFGLFLPTSGPDAMPNHGIGPFLYDLDSYRPTVGYVAPTETVEDGAELEVDGVRLVFYDAPSDTDDTLLMWIPEKQTVVNNIVWPALFNIYTLRGSEFRNPLALLRGLDLIRELRPEHLVGVHGAPIHGQDRIYELATSYRDAIQYLYDQTVRAINAGQSPDEMAQRIRLPEHLVAANPLLRELYGEVPYAIRQIYSGLVGWFGKDTVELHPLPEQEQGRRLVDLMGGADRVKEEARLAFEAGELEWAAQLATYALHADPEDATSRAQKAETLRALGQSSTAANTRSWYLTQARELEGEVDTMRPPVKMVNVNQVLQAPPTTYLNALRYEVDPVAAGGVEEVVAFRFTDRDTVVRLHLRHSIIEVLEDNLADPTEETCALSLSFETWARCAAGETTLTAELASGTAQQSGSPEAMERVLDCLPVTGRGQDALARS